MIKLSKIWDTALKAACYMADKKSLVHIKDIALSESLSEGLLRRVIADLERWGIVETVKGRNGWVKLAKLSKEISAYHILEAAWEELWLVDCTKDIYCEKKTDCYTTDTMWSLQRGFNSLLKMHTLDKIIKK